MKHVPLEAKVKSQTKPSIPLEHAPLLGETSITWGGNFAFLQSVLQAPLPISMSTSIASKFPIKTTGLCSTRPTPLCLEPQARPYLKSKVQLILPIHITATSTHIFLARGHPCYSASKAASYMKQLWTYQVSRSPLQFMFQPVFQIFPVIFPPIFRPLSRSWASQETQHIVILVQFKVAKLELISESRHPLFHLVPFFVLVSHPNLSLHQ